MIVELGHYALVLALCLAITQVVFPLLGASRNVGPYMQLARYAAMGQLFFVSISFFILGYAFLSNDFSVAYVAENSNTQLPWIYRFCAIWGAHEGSLLLWVFILTIWMAAVSVWSRSLPLDMLARVLAVLALIAIGFYLFLLTTSDPFLRLLPNIPLNGNDLNPLLQDPGLVSHPPMLYMGYVGFSVAFAFAIAALLSGRLDAVWAKWTRPWTIVAWCFLTLGIVLGSWWSYRVLGWGGWWFWDPVENASFMPWLAGTALIHSLIVTEKRNVFKAWTVLLAVFAFSLSLLGTFLVRSGVLISVHAFAVDPKRGAFILQFLTIVVGGSLFLYAWRAKKIVSKGFFGFWSREVMLLGNNLLLFIAMITVLLGTLYPLIIDALGLGKLSVGAPYFNLVFIPIMAPLFFLMGIAPYFYWEYRSPHLLWKRFILTLLLVTMLGCLGPWLVGASFHWSACLGLSLAFWILMNNAFQIRWLAWRRSQWSMVFAHAGVAVTLMGIVLTTTYSVERDVTMREGGSLSIGPYQLVFNAIDKLNGPNYSGVVGDLQLYRSGKVIAALHPELRFYRVSQTTIAKTAIDASVFRDIYVALGEPLNDNVWGFRIYYKPFVRWIWFGGFLMIMGGVVSLSSKRCRKKE